MLRWLFGRRKRPRAIIIPGDGRYRLKIVGTSQYQADLAMIAGSKTVDGKQHDCVAHLVPEPENEFDVNAVACWIAGRKVGYLPREDAALFMDQTREFGEPDLQARLNARIIGGSKGAMREGRDASMCGVRLDWKA